MSNTILKHSRITVTIDGEDFILKFGEEANRIMIPHFIENAERYEQQDVNLKDLAQIMHAGYVNQCTVTDSKPAKGVGFFYGYLEDFAIEAEAQIEYQRILQAYLESKAFQAMFAKLTTISDKVIREKFAPDKTN